MKIAQIVCTYPPYRGGIGNSAKKFTGILEGDHEIVTFTPLYNKKNEEEEKIKRIKPFLKYGNAALLPRLIFKLKKYDIIYLHYPFFGTDLVIWFYKTFINRKKKLIIHYHMDVSELSLFAKIASPPAFLIKKNLLKKADAITCFSSDYVKSSSVADIYKKTKEKWIEIPYAVDIKKFKPAKGKNDKTNILFVGGLDKAHYFKGLDNLLEAVGKLNTSFTLNIVGDGSLKKDYKRRAEKLGLRDRVNFTGSVGEGELIKIYNKSDFLVLPSIDKSEALGIVLIEAMACGLPVIASDLPGVRSVFENNKQGLIVKTADIVDLKNKIEYLIKNRETREMMGGKARKLALDKYSEAKMRKSLQKAINL